MDGEKSKRRREDSRQETRWRGGAGSCTLHAASRKDSCVFTSSLSESITDLCIAEREGETDRFNLDSSLLNSDSSLSRSIRLTATRSRRYTIHLTSHTLSNQVDPYSPRTARIFRST